MIFNVKHFLYKIIFLSPFLLSILTLTKLKFLFIFIFTLFFIVFINLDYLKRKKIVSLVIFDSLFIFNFLYGVIKLNDFLYFKEYDFLTYTLLVSFLFYWSDKSNIERNNKIISSMRNTPFLNAIITFVLLLYALIAGFGFVAKHQTIIFIGIYGLEHELAYHLLCSYSLLMYAERFFNYNKKFSNLFKLIFSIFIILTGVRTALLILIILIFLDFKKMKFIYKILLLFTLILGFGFVSLNSHLLENVPLISKSLISSEAGDVTNGRFVMSERGLSFYLNKTSDSEKLFGITMTNLRKNVFWDGLHAHNDFVNILLGFGLINFLYFIYLLYRLKKNSTFELLLLVVLTAFFNGLFMYYEFVLSIPLFIELTKKDV